MMKHDDSCRCKPCRINKPSYNKQRRISALRLVGSVCHSCGEWYDDEAIKSNLELHHLYYTEGNSQKQKEVINTTTEAINHPFRFWSLCKTCHTLHTYLIYNEWKLLRFIERYYLRQLRYTYPYDMHLKEIGKGYIFFGSQYNYKKPEEFNDEFSEFLFKSKDDMYKKYSYIKSLSADVGLISREYSRRIEKKELLKLKQKILFALDDVMMLYDSFFVNQYDKSAPSISNNITNLFQILRSKIEYEKLPLVGFNPIRL